MTSQEFISQYKKDRSGKAMAYPTDLPVISGKKYITMKIPGYLKLPVIILFLMMRGGLMFSQCPSYTLDLLNSSTGQTMCPWGLPTDLSAQLKNAGSPVAGASYTWQPGAYTSTLIFVTPTITTTYTVSASVGGCTYTTTTTVQVMPVAVPTISYSIVAFQPTASVSFPVTQTGVTGGSYYIQPSHPMVSIDPSTGLISASGNSYGTYTVTYHVFGFGQPGEFCEDYDARTVIMLSESECPVLFPVSGFSLCPDDKLVFNPVLFYPGGGDFHENDPDMIISWLPAPTSTAGLNCTSCLSPTLVFEGVPTIYTLTTTYKGTVCATATLDINVKEYCEKDDIIGCCFSNYGAEVWLNDQNTYLNVYCNLINEQSLMDGASLKGRFTNTDGTVRVLLDWIHNARNDLFATQTGTTSLIGSNQQVKGNSHTHFHELWLEGNGLKTIWINTFAHGSLDLKSNILNTQNFSFLMKNAAAEVRRTSGFAETGLYGSFSHILGDPIFALGLGQPLPVYLYPLGARASASSPFRYRPLVIGNIQPFYTDEVMASFMNRPPALSTDPVFVNANPALTNVITDQAPNVLQLNNAFYHKIIKTETQSNNSRASHLSIRSYYLPADGQFQSLAEWERGAGQTLDWWGSTPGASASTIPSADPGTPGMIFAMANGNMTLRHPPFILSRGGFYLNTGSFGNIAGGGPGTLFSVASVTPGGGGPTPSGGGLNSPHPAGPSSANPGGNVIFTPSPVAGKYVMSVTPSNSCAIGGNISFEIDQSGNIDPASVKYGITPNVYLGELSEAVYTIDQVNSGITFSAVPASLLRQCVNTITVTTLTDNDHILTPGDDIQVLLPAVGNSSNTITYGHFRMFDKSNVPVYTSPGVLTPGLNTYSPTLPADVYRFEFQVTASTVPPLTEVIKGQIIVK